MEPAAAAAGVFEAGTERQGAEVAAIGQVAEGASCTAALEGGAPPGTGAWRARPPAPSTVPGAGIPIPTGPELGGWMPGGAPGAPPIDAAGPAGPGPQGPEPPSPLRVERIAWPCLASKAAKQVEGAHRPTELPQVHLAVCVTASGGEGATRGRPELTEGAAAHCVVRVVRAAATGAGCKPPG
jgi:hypothetical protein